MTTHFMPETYETFVSAWRCKTLNHDRERIGGCWTSSHISRSEIEAEAARDGDGCTCWRHRILQYTDEDGTYIGPDRDSPEEQIRIRAEYVEKLRPDWQYFSAQASMLKRKIDQANKEILTYGGTVEEEKKNEPIDFSDLLKGF